MGLRTTSQLQADFPNATTQQCAASLKTLDQLVRDGFLGDNLGEVYQIQNWIMSYTNTKGESFTPTAAVVGASGSTLRTYAARPRYPLPMGSPGNMTALYTGDMAANYENEAPGKPPQGRSNPFTFLAGGTVQDNRTTLIGKPPTSTLDVTTTPATLTQTNYVAVTAPAIGLVPGTTFDILVQESGTESQAVLFATTGTVSTADSVVATFSTKGGTVAQGPYTYPCTASETPAQILAGVLAMLIAQTEGGVTAPLFGWTFRSSGLYLIAAAPEASDTMTLNPSASTHVLLNGSNASTGAISIPIEPPFMGIAFNVAPGAVIQDNGTLVRMPYDQLGEYPFAEVWVDTSLNPIFSFSVGTTTTSDAVTINFTTKGGAGTYSVTYPCSASQSAASIVAGLLALVQAQIGNGLPLQGWTATSPTTTQLQFVSPDPQPDENNSQGGNVYGDFVAVDVSGSPNVTVDSTYAATLFAIGITGTVTTSDSLVGTIAYNGGTNTLTVTYPCTASETAAQIATGFAAAFNLQTGSPTSPLYGWACKVFNSVDLAFGSPQASGNTVTLNPTASTHVLVNGSNAATSATAVGKTLDTKAVGPLLLERFSRVNVFESAGGAPNTLQQGGAEYVGPLV